MAEVVVLAPDQLLELASLVADLLVERLDTRPRAGLVDVQAVAAHLGVEPDFVYRHADELGVRRLGDGPKAPLRFRLAEVDERLRSCSAARGPGEPSSAAVERRTRRRRTRGSGTGVPLLPIRGEIRG